LKNLKIPAENSVIPGNSRGNSWDGGFPGIREREFPAAMPNNLRPMRLLTLVQRKHPQNQAGIGVASEAHKSCKISEMMQDWTTKVRPTITD